MQQVKTETQKRKWNWGMVIGLCIIIVAALFIVSNIIVWRVCDTTSSLWMIPMNVLVIVQGIAVYLTNAERVAEAGEPGAGEMV